MRIDLPTGTEATLARPDGEASRGLVVAIDINGLRPLFDDMAARLAAEHGWVVCAPEPFPGQALPDLEARFDAMARLDDATQLAHLTAAADATGCDRVGVVGFCMGGMYALKASTARRFDRAVSFYGMIRVPERWRGLGQGEPLDMLQSAHCPVLALLGGRDPWTPPADVDALRQVPEVEVVVYPEADHAFVHDPARPSHRPEDAADAWRRVAAFMA